MIFPSGPVTSKSSRVPALLRSGSRGRRSLSGACVIQSRHGRSATSTACSTAPSGKPRATATLPRTWGVRRPAAQGAGRRDGDIAAGGCPSRADCATGPLAVRHRRPRARNRDVPQRIAGAALAGCRPGRGQPHGQPVARIHPEARAAVQGAQGEARAARSPCPRISLTRAGAVAKPVAVVSPARPLALALVIAFVSLAHATPIERASLRVRVSPNLYARQSKPCDPAPGIDEKPGKVSFSVRMRYAPDEREYLVAVSRCCGGPNGD